MDTMDTKENGTLCYGSLFSLKQEGQVRQGRDQRKKSLLLSAGGGNEGF